MTEYDLIRDWTLHAGIDEEAAKRVLFRLKLEDGWKEFLEGDSLREEIDDLKSTNEDLESSNEDLEMEVSNLTDKIERLEERLVALGEDIDV